MVCWSSWQYIKQLFPLLYRTIHHRVWTMAHRQHINFQMYFCYQLLCVASIWHCQQNITFLGLEFNNYMLTKISVWVWITEHWSVRSFETNHTMPTHVYIFDEEGIYHIWFSNCRIKRNLGCRKFMLFHSDDTCKLNVRPIINIEKSNQNPVMAVH